MIPPQEYNKPPITGLKKVESHELPEKELKIIVPKKLRKLQEKRYTQFNKIRNTTQDKKSEIQLLFLYQFVLITKFWS